VFIKANLEEGKNKTNKYGRKGENNKKNYIPKQ
jgi:hypothetical protein